MDKPSVAPGEAQRCEYCGPNCYGGAGHNARVEARDKEYPSAVPSEVEAQRETLADICPSCGSTDKNERAVCANQWHAVPSKVTPITETFESASADYPQGSYLRTVGGRVEMATGRYALEYPDKPSLYWHGRAPFVMMDIADWPRGHLGKPSREQRLEDALRKILSLFSDEPKIYLRPCDPNHRMTYGDSDRVDEVFIAAEKALEGTK